MQSYLYIFGRTPDLAFFELKSFLPDIDRLVPEIARSSQLIPIENLGGTVKIAQIVGQINEVNAETLASYVSAGSTFGISKYPTESIPRSLLEDIKKISHAKRYVEARNGRELSSVVIEKNHIDELIVVKNKTDIIVAKTITVQPFEDWNKRDFGRPYADPVSGMLPPKVARMSVNIAGRGENRTLLDPFCGMGTILSEALVMGWSVVGSDQLEAVVGKAQKNLEWLALGVFQLYISDATHISEKIVPESIDAIVTEPFMGDPHKVQLGGHNIRNIIKGLEKLYIGCLREWYKILKKDGVIVMALPKYIVNGKTYFVKKVIDTCENLGYTIEAGPIEYGRPQAVVKREFYQFKKIWHT